MGGLVVETDLAIDSTKRGVVGHTTAEIIDYVSTISRERIRIQSGHADIGCLECRNLVVHQGKQR